MDRLIFHIMGLILFSTFVVFAFILRCSFKIIEFRPKRKDTELYFGSLNCKALSLRNSDYRLIALYGNALYNNIKIIKKKTKHKTHRLNDNTYFHFFFLVIGLCYFSTNPFGFDKILMFDFIIQLCGIFLNFEFIPQEMFLSKLENRVYLLFAGDIIFVHLDLVDINRRFMIT